MIIGIIFSIITFGLIIFGLVLFFKSKKINRWIKFAVSTVIILVFSGNRTRLYFYDSIMYQAKTAYEQGNYKLAIKKYTNANKLIFDKQQKASNIFWCGRAYYYGEQDYDTALKYFSKAIELHPDYYVYYLWRGRAYEEKEEWDNVIAELNKVIELKPDDYQRIKERGDIYLFQKDDKTLAILDYDLAIAEIEAHIIRRLQLSIKYPDINLDNTDLYMWREEVIIQRNFIERLNYFSAFEDEILRSHLDKIKNIPLTDDDIFRPTKNE